MSQLNTYLLVFDSTRAPNSWMSVQQYIADSKDVVAYWNYIPLVFMVKTPLSLIAMSEKFTRVLGGANFLLAQVTPYSVNGWLPKQAWDWINADHSTPQPSFSWENLLLQGPSRP